MKYVYIIFLSLVACIGNKHYGMQSNSVSKPNNSGGLFSMIGNLWSTGMRYTYGKDEENQSDSNMSIGISGQNNPLVLNDSDILSSMASETETILNDNNKRNRIFETTQARLEEEQFIDGLNVPEQEKIKILKYRAAASKADYSKRLEERDELIIQKLQTDKNQIEKMLVQAYSLLVLKFNYDMSKLESKYVKQISDMKLDFKDTICEKEKTISANKLDFEIQKQKLNDENHNKDKLCLERISSMDKDYQMQLRNNDNQYSKSIMAIQKQNFEKEQEYQKQLTTKNEELSQGRQLFMGSIFARELKSNADINSLKEHYESRIYLLGREIERLNSTLDKVEILVGTLKSMNISGAECSTSYTSTSSSSKGWIWKDTSYSSSTSKTQGNYFLNINRNSSQIVNGNGVHLEIALNPELISMLNKIINICKNKKYE